MNTLQDNRYTRAWRALAADIARPRAILAISAHWYIAGTAVTAMSEPRTIHDFSGFPDALFRFEYGAPGSPELAAQVSRLAEPTRVLPDSTSWGLDHGTWSVLAHMYPEADVPVVQLAIDAGKSVSEHVALGAALEPLRRDGVLILSSGNVVHNLEQIRIEQSGEPLAWNADFDEYVHAIMNERPGDIGDVVRHPAYSLAAPTPEHLIPLYYLAGIALAAGQTATRFIAGAAMGSLSMSGYIVEAQRVTCGQFGEADSMDLAGTEAR